MCNIYPCRLRYKINIFVKEYKVKTLYTYTRVAERERERERERGGE